jgi:hypothetical protein
MEVSLDAHRATLRLFAERQSIVDVVQVTILPAWLRPAEFHSSIEPTMADYTTDVSTHRTGSSATPREPLRPLPESTILELEV